MKAVIMCGGLGSRLRPLTETTPKPLIRLLNVPVLKHIIDKVIAAGITDISLALGYKAHQIIEYCEIAGFDAQISYFEEEKPLGTAGGVKNCVGRTKEDVLVLSGDNVFTIDLQKAFVCHAAANADVTIVGREAADPREYGCIVCDEENRITGFAEKPTWETAESFLINTGIYILKGSVLDLIPARTNYDFGDQLFPDLMQQNKKMICFKTDGFWGDIGAFEAYRAITREMLNTFTADFVYSGSLYTEDREDERGNRFIAPCLVAEGCVFGSRNTVGPYTVLGRDVRIGDGCTVRGSILGEGARVDSNTDVIDAIADDAVRIGESCLMEKNAVLGYGVSVGRFSRILENCRIWPGRSRN